MASLDAWLERQAQRERRLVTLEDALLGNRAAAYALYRFRYFAFRCLASSALHGIRLTLLQYVFSHRVFLQTLVLHAVTGLLTSFWWGSLEALRERVRRLSRDGRHDRVRVEIGRWLTVATALAALSLLAPAAWIAWDTGTRGRTFDVLHLYIFAVGFRLSADFITLTLHSGIYAVRRVYRPLPAMIAAELAGVLLVLALWPWLGRSSFPIAMLASTVVAAGVVVHYTSRLYGLLGWRPIRLARPVLAPFRSGRAAREIFSAGASYALMKLDALLMLAMFSSGSGAPGGITLFVLFASVGPAVQAGFDWARLLYFDLKRLDARCLRALLRRYERLAFHLAWVVGIALWGLACVLGTVITRQSLGPLYWLIGPFFVSRSFLAVAQIQAFSKRQYGALLASGAAFLALVPVLEIGLPGESERLLALAAACSVIAWVVWAAARRSKGGAFDPEVLPFTEWLERLKEVREPVRLRSLRFPDGARRRPGAGRGDAPYEGWWRHRRMAERIARRVRELGAVTLPGPGRVAWYEIARGPASIRRGALLGWGGGLIHSITSSPVEENGVRALQTALETNLLGDRLPGRDRPGMGPIRAEDVQDAFSEMFPQGVTYSPERPVPLMLDGISSRERRAILFEAVHFARHLDRSPRSRGFDVTSFCSNGELNLIFIVGREHDPRRRLEWRRRVRALNLEAALAGAARALETLPLLARDPRLAQHDREEPV